MRFVHGGKPGFLVSLHTEGEGVFVHWSLNREKDGKPSRFESDSFSGVIPIADFLRLTRPYCRPGIHFSSFPAKRWRGTRRAHTKRRG